MDDALILRAKAGDRVALEDLLAVVAPLVRRFGLRMCKNEHDADDVLQDTLISVLHHLDEFEGRSSFSSWVFTLVRTACNRRRRGMKNAPNLPLDAATDRSSDAPSPEQMANSLQMGALLEAALLDLPDEQRDAVVLRDVQELSAAEAAASIGITVEALKSRLHRARLALRSALQPALEPLGAPQAAGCPDVMNLWARKLQGDLNAADCAEMEKHVASCRVCATACHGLKTALGTCRREATNDVKPEIQAAVKAAIQTWMARIAPEQQR